MIKMMEDSREASSFYKVGCCLSTTKPTMRRPLKVSDRTDYFQKKCPKTWGTEAKNV